MRIAVLWSQPSGYLNACLRALNALPGCRLMVVYERPPSIAPFDEKDFAWISDLYVYDGAPDARELQARLERFRPDVLLVTSWHISAFRRALRRFPAALRVLAMDNQWRATPKQWFGVITARWCLHPLYDVAFVPGERQARFARYLGFSERQIWRGLYSCDHPSFASVARERHARPRWTPEKCFLFVGRIEAHKGIKTLAAAYQVYRKREEQPWPLIISGIGSLGNLLNGQDGVVMKGFVQPTELPGILAEAGCFVLPSTFEPWGIVIHEAAAAGLAVICSNQCGASVHLVQDGYNGFLVEAEDADGLSYAMSRYARLDEAKRREMSNNSFRLSLQFTPARWASLFQVRATEAIAAKRTAISWRTLARETEKDRL